MSCLGLVRILSQITGGQKPGFSLEYSSHLAETAKSPVSLIFMRSPFNETQRSIALNTKSAIALKDYSFQ
ncbi:hypothetical protein QUB64_12060 [Microcoleus sp. Aus8_D2]